MTAWDTSYFHENLFEEPQNVPPGNYCKTRRFSLHRECYVWANIMFPNAHQIQTIKQMIFFVLSHLYILLNIFIVIWVGCFLMAAIHEDKINVYICDITSVLGCFSLIAFPRSYFKKCLESSLFNGLIVVKSLVYTKYQIWEWHTFQARTRSGLGWHCKMMRPEKYTYTNWL